MNLLPEELPEALQMDERPNYRPTVLMREARSVALQLALRAAVVLALLSGLGFTIGYAIAGLVDWWGYGG